MSLAERSMLERIAAEFPLSVMDANREVIDALFAAGLALTDLDGRVLGLTTLGRQTLGLPDNS